MEVAVGVGVNVKVNRTGPFDGLYAMGSLGGALGLLKGKYLCKVKLDNYNPSKLGSKLGESVGLVDDPIFMGVDEYIGDSRTILEVYDIESIVDQICNDYQHFYPSPPSNKYIILRYLIWGCGVSPFELVQKYFSHLIQNDQEVY